MILQVWQQNINDATKTEVSFKEDYDFSKEGTVEVIIQVKDKGNNVTEKKGKVKVTKDSEPPKLQVRAFDDRDRGKNRL